MRPPPPCARPATVPIRRHVLAAAAQSAPIMFAVASAIAIVDSVGRRNSSSQSQCCVLAARSGVPRLERLVGTQRETSRTESGSGTADVEVVAVPVVDSDPVWRHLRPFISCCRSSRTGSPDRPRRPWWWWSLAAGWSCPARTSPTSLPPWCGGWRARRTENPGRIVLADIDDVVDAATIASVIEAGKPRAVVRAGVTYTARVHPTAPPQRCWLCRRRMARGGWKSPRPVRLTTLSCDRLPRSPRRWRPGSPCRASRHRGQLPRSHDRARHVFRTSRDGKLRRLA